MTLRSWSCKYIMPRVFEQSPGWEDYSVEMQPASDPWNQRPDATHRQYQDNIDNIVVEVGWEYLIRCRVEKSHPRTNLCTVHGQMAKGGRVTVNYGLRLVVVSPNFEGDRLYLFDPDWQPEIGVEIALWLRLGEHDFTAGTFSDGKSLPPFDKNAVFVPTGEVFKAGVTEASPLDILSEIVEREMPQTT